MKYRIVRKSKTPTFLSYNITFGWKIVILKLDSNRQNDLVIILKP